MNNKISELKPLKINIILPWFDKRAGGGIKVMYEYAKRLSNRGDDVVVYHSTKTSYTSYENRSNFFVWFKYWVRYLYKRNYKINQRPSWFILPDKVVCKRIPYITDSYIRDADICLSTWWGTTFDVVKLKKSKGRKFNLIQAYETIMTSHPASLVHDSFQLPLHQIVISKYLYDIVSLHTSKKIYYVPNAIDLDIYRVINPIEMREPHSIIMRYTTQKDKACHYALEAFSVLKEKYTDLEVTLFSSQKKTADIPNWINYVYGTSDTTPLYNKASIFVSSSIEEGWGLPPMEAMACGCACVCTKIPSHLLYMKDRENCLLVEPADSSGIVDQISFLIENPLEIKRISEAAINSMKPYDWENSVDLLENIFLLNS